MRTLGIIVAAVVSPALLPIVIVGAMARHAEPLEPPNGRPTALYWADRLFVSKPEFAAWLESRGVTYEQWVGRHPGASPWERRAASPVRPAKPAAAAGEAALPDRPLTEEPGLSERVRSLLGAVRGALLPAMVVLCVAFILVMLARARRTIGELAAAALEATRARLRRAAPSPGVLAGLAGWSRIADGRARPAFTAEGSPRLSLALEPVSAVGAPPAGAPRGRGIRRPSGNDGRAEDAPRAAPIVGPVELERPAPPSTMDDVAQPAEPDRAAHAPRLRPVYRPVARAVAPVPPQRWRAQMRRPLPADTSAPTTPESVPPPVGVAADEAGEPLALEPELAVAAEREEETAGALRLDDQTVACTISVWHGYVNSRFYARVSTPDGETHTLAESPPFRRRGEVPEALPDAVSAHEALLEHLRAEGWRPVGSLGAWYAICLQPTAPAFMSIPR